MGELSALLISQGVGTAASVGNAYSQTNAMRGAQQYSSGMARVNYDWAEIQKQDALRRGAIGASRDRLQGKQIDAAMRVKAAGQGVDVNSGSAAATRSDQRLFMDLAALDSQQNAYRQAIGIRAEQSALMGRDRMNRQATRNQIRNTLLQTGMGIGSDALRSYAMYERYNPGKDDELYVKPPGGKNMSDPRNR